MSSSDAWKFPFIGSGVLFGLYIAFKAFSKDSLNFLLTVYFLFFGVVAIGQTVRPLIAPLFGPLKPVKVTLYFDDLSFEFDKADIPCLMIGILAAYWYLQQKHWIANNVFGLAFCIQAIGFFSLGSYSVGCQLLGGLFVYDIFWVFGTDVMVTVAKSFEAPVKLLFPRNGIFADEPKFSMLGLGDIVIPGFFLALLLRFDYGRANEATRKDGFSRPYFNITFLFYILSLLTTIFVMHNFQAAQPALLYLVPGCIGSSFFLSLIRGERKELLAYSEGSEKEKRDKVAASQNPATDKPATDKPATDKPAATPAEKPAEKLTQRDDKSATKTKTSKGKSGKKPE